MTSAAISLQTVLAGGSLFECPRWRDLSWWVSDIYAGRVLRVSDTGEAAVVLQLSESDGRPSGLGWSPEGDLLVVINNRRQVWRVAADGTVSVHADCGAQLERHGNFNDMVVAADGRAFISNMGHGNIGTARSGVPAPTCITVIDPDGRAHDEGADLNFPNGMVLADAGQTLIVSETGARRLTAFDVAADGSLDRRRTWADLASVDHWPDGCCRDADGAIWTASPRGRRGWLRVAEGGRVLSRIPAPSGMGAYACALGATDMRTLLLCAAADDSTGAGSELYIAEL